jgi:hypothetical protein
MSDFQKVQMSQEPVQLFDRVPFIELFWDFQIPDDMREGYGVSGAH